MERIANVRRRDFSFEITARSGRAVALCREHLDPETCVYIASIPGDPPDAVLPAARALRDAGLRPVPHVTARALADLGQLDALLADLSEGAGVDRIFLIGGDLGAPVGPFASSLAVLRTGRLAARGLREVGFALYPEPHPKVSAAELGRALTAKLDAAVEQCLQPWLVTQFCFAADQIVAHLRMLRADGIAAPVRIGLAGPVERRALLRYALQCGIGTSVRALGARRGTVRGLLTGGDPGAIVDELDRTIAPEPDLGVAGLHIFPFGDIAAAADWARHRTTIGGPYWASAAD